MCLDVFIRTWDRDVEMSNWTKVRRFIYLRELCTLSRRSIVQVLLFNFL